MKICEIMAMCAGANKHDFYRLRVYNIMNKLTGSKFIVFFALGISMIISVSACSLAIPETVYISNIELTDNSDQILVKVSDADYHKWELIYDIPSMELKNVDSNVNIADIEIRPSLQNYSSQLFDNGTDALWILTNGEDNSVYEFRFGMNVSRDTEMLVENMFFVSSSLRTAYLILPYDLDTSGGIKDSVLRATVVIASLDDPENIKFSYVAHSYLTDFYSISFELYDGFQIFYLHGNGADCVNSVYFNYDRDSFQFLSQTSAWQRDLIDPRTSKLIVASYAWESGTSEISLTDLNNFKEQSFVVSDDSIMTLLGITTEHTSLSSESSTTLTDSLSATLPIFGIYLPMGVILLVFIGKWKFRNSNR